MWIPWTKKMHCIYVKIKVCSILYYSKRIMCVFSFLFSVTDGVHGKSPSSLSNMSTNCVVWNWKPICTHHRCIPHIPATFEMNDLDPISRTNKTVLTELSLCVLLSNKSLIVLPVTVVCTSSQCSQWYSIQWCAHPLNAHSDTVYMTWPR